MSTPQPNSQSSTTSFNSLEDITLSLILILKPPERLTVSQTAAKYRYLNNMGSYVGPWKNSVVNYMVEPMDTLSSREHDGLIFVGPAQSGKTDALIINWIAHSIRSDPMDIIVYSPTGAAARDFSMRRVDRLHRHSPEIGSQLQSGRDSDNRLDKHYRTGTMLTLSHPSVTELAGKPVPRVALTDYDRMPDDIDGDGSPYDLAAKRTTTFKSFAMALAESSPSREITDMKWIARTPHEAPPAKGIFALYNRGDRRRWYWPCPHCNEYFEGEFSHLEWDRTRHTALDQAESVYMVCPNNACIIQPDERADMQMWGTWLRDFQGFDPEGRVIGEGQRTMIASFWLKGVAASFASWQKLVSTYLAAMSEFETTGSEEALKKFYNTDLAEPYIPRGLESERLPENLKGRSEGPEALPEKEVPDNVRFLIACVDVQKNMFVVQVHGISPGKPYDIVLIDRFSIQKSKRVDHDGERLWVKPATYAEDWDLVTEQVIQKSYPLGDGSGRRMVVKITCCDSGGKAGTTANAYDYYRKLKSEGLAGRFQLVKGDKNVGQARARISYPDAAKKDRSAAARGDVPLLMLNSNVLKDALSGRLDCITPGSGMYRFPDWLPDWWFVEMCSEQRTPKGWINPPHSRNEAWDLSYYCLGICASKILLVEHIDWARPPNWAREWDKNDMVSQPNKPDRFSKPIEVEYDFSKFGEALA
jgi:phage terminase large subunit GpA-like protein